MKSSISFAILAILASAGTLAAPVSLGSSSNAPAPTVLHKGEIHHHVTDKDVREVGALAHSAPKDGKPKEGKAKQNTPVTMDGKDVRNSQKLESDGEGKHPKGDSKKGDTGEASKPIQKLSDNKGEASKPIQKFGDNKEGKHPTGDTKEENGKTVKTPKRDTQTDAQGAGLANKDANVNVALFPGTTTPGKTGVVDAETNNVGAHVIQTPGTDETVADATLSDGKPKDAVDAKVQLPTADSVFGNGAGAGLAGKPGNGVKANSVNTPLSDAGVGNGNNNGNGRGNSSGSGGGSGQKAAPDQRLAAQSSQSSAPSPVSSSSSSASATSNAIPASASPQPSASAPLSASARPASSPSASPSVSAASASALASALSSASSLAAAQSSSPQHVQPLTCSSSLDGGNDTSNIPQGVVDAVRNGRVGPNRLAQDPTNEAQHDADGNAVPYRVPFGTRPAHVEPCDGVYAHAESDLVDMCIAASMLQYQPEGTVRCPDTMQHDVQAHASSTGTNKETMNAKASKDVAQYLRLCMSAGAL